MNYQYSLFFILLLATIAGCKQPVKVAAKPIADTTPITIIIQPFADIPEDQVEYVHSSLVKIYPFVIVQKKIAFPEHAMNALGYRYRADSLLKFLKTIVHDHQTILGLTGRDISTSNGDKPDWGVMGLGSCPGNTCIASSFRLVQERRMEQFFKIAIHELGHTNCLQHCPVKTCFMRDAKGGNTTNEEKEFCSKCKGHLKEKFWNL